MSKAAEMFEKLGYFIDTKSYVSSNILAFNKWNEDDVIVYHKTDVFNKIRNKVTDEWEDIKSEVVIIFDFKNKWVIKKSWNYPEANVWIHYEELQAINEKVKELGWNE